MFGVLHGLRVWRLDVRGIHTTSAAICGWRPAIGRIVGSLRSTYLDGWQWGDGVNTATCLRRETSHCSVLDFDDEEASATAEHNRTTVPANCGCGFWAYTAGEPFPSIPGDVLGVIEAWGSLVIGPRGFRAQHARIIAFTWTHPTDDAEMVPTAKTGGIRDFTYGALRREIRSRYPSAKWFDNDELMLHTHPLSDATALL
jgi:hypothetical protein